MEYKISIIVPVYKVEDYLSRCVDSLICQTYKNLEIILVDDGSPDRCGAICDEYAKRDERVKVIHKQNGGLSDARNRGIDIASGDYVMFVDSDDWLANETCELIISDIIENKADIVVFGFSYVYESDKVVHNYIRLNGKITKDTAIMSLIYKVGYWGIGNYAWNKVYLKNLFEDVRFPVSKVAEDQGTTYKLFDKAETIYVNKKNCYNYFQRGDSISHNRFEPSQIKDRISLWIERLDFFKENYPQFVKFQIAQLLGDIYVAIILLKGNKEQSDLRTMLQNYANQYEEKKYLSLDKKIRLHYYCYPLFWLYVRIIVR